MNYYTLIALLLVTGTVSIVLVSRKRFGWKTPIKAFKSSWRDVLEKHVEFYNHLNSKNKAEFEYKVHEFLLNCSVTGHEIDVEEKDRVLVAASAIIPIFKFPEWRYSNLKEVILYPDRISFFETKGVHSSILGLVGTGPMEGKMILSRKALYLGFSNRTDKKNTAVHEFIHLIDKMDGLIDGIPKVLMDEPNMIPWVELMDKKIQEINKGNSDINNYGGTSHVEFFTVVSEYFFERPQLLKKKHPELYNSLVEFFDTDMASHGLKEK